MKTPNSKKNARCKLVGKAVPFSHTYAKEFDHASPAFDPAAWTLRMLADMKKNLSQMPARVQEDLSTWNPPTVHCACGFIGPLTECGRTSFPPLNIGWDCPACHQRLPDPLPNDIQTNHTNPDSGTPA